METILCACGCGQTRAARGSDGRLRRFINGHQAVKYQSAAERQTARRATWRRFYEANKPRYAEHNRRWIQDNQERRKAVHGPYREVWRKENPAKIADYSRRRRAYKKGVALTEIDYGWLQALYGKVCQLCKKDIDRDLTWDHIIPLAKGGCHSTENLQPTHRACNSRKGTKVG